MKDLREENCFDKGFVANRDPFATPKKPKKFRWSASLIVLFVALVLMASFYLSSYDGDYRNYAKNYGYPSRQFFEDVLGRIDTYEELENIMAKGYENFNKDVSKYSKSFFTKNSLVITTISYTFPIMTVVDKAIRTEDGVEVYYEYVDISEPDAAYPGDENLYFIFFEIPDSDLDNGKEFKVFYPEK